MFCALKLRRASNCLRSLADCGLSRGPSCFNRSEKKWLHLRGASGEGYICLSQRRAMAEHTKQYVYFGISGREVKIGLAHDPPNRIADMRTARPNIKLFGCIPGSRETERHLHQCFSKDRISGEWFYFTPEVEAALRELLNNNNEAVPAPDQIKNSCGEEFRHRQRELRIKHFKNLKLYPVMLRVGDKK